MNFTSRIIKPFATTALLIVTICYATGQGDLDPPTGSPAPNMKTLQEIWDKLGDIETGITGVESDVAGVVADPRTPITSLPITIDQPGSYYFTGNLEFTDPTGNAIDITADNVTLDLNGFTLSSVATVTGRAISIAIPAGGVVNNTTVRNGKIVGNTTVTDIGTTWTVVEGGFQSGISCSGTGCRVEEVGASACRESGIEVTFDSYVSNCAGFGNGGTGISASWGSGVFNCVAKGNGDRGISGLKATCRGSTARQNGGHGIDQDRGIVTECFASDNRLDGIRISGGAGVVTQSFAEENGGADINATGATLFLNEPTP